MVSNLYGKLKNSDESASCICKRPAQLLLWLVISAIISFIFILPYCYDRIKTYSNVWNQFNDGRDQRWTDTKKTSDMGSYPSPSLHTWFFGTSDIGSDSDMTSDMNSDKIMTSDTDLDTDILRTRVSAHLFSWHQNFRSCLQIQINIKKLYAYMDIHLFPLLNWNFTGGLLKKMIISSVVLRMNNEFYISPSEKFLPVSLSFDAFFMEGLLLLVCCLWFSDFFTFPSLPFYRPQQYWPIRCKRRLVRNKQRSADKEEVGI